jgi:hypothetical protein
MPLWGFACLAMGLRMLSGMDVAVYVQLRATSRPAPETSPPCLRRTTVTTVGLSSRLTSTTTGYGVDEWGKSTRYVAAGVEGERI